MSKIKCPECGAKYSGNFCPNCSAPAPAVPRKKKKKWILPVIIVAVLLLIIIGASGGDDVKQPSEVKADPSATASKVNPENQEGRNETRSSSVSNKVTVSESELYNHNGITVTVSGYSEGMFGPEIALLVSNDSDTNVSVTTRSLSVNGYMLASSGLYCDVAAGKKANSSINLLRSELDAAGVKTVAELVFQIAVFDSATYEDIDVSDLITLTTSAAEGFTQPVDDSGDTVYEDNGIRVVCKGLKDDVIWDGCVVFYLENASDRNVSVYSENVSVNGYMVDESLWSDLRPGTRSVEGMYLLTLENIGISSIDEVETLEFSLHIVDENWGDIAVSQPITLKFN